ncbi:DUF7298 domain-containing protein [Streptomyces antibioticus]|uniref:DUF7298 domain-containing protein n=1 Tax=Streptomyces antibioticus TaxID=1890 RepID=UPI003F44EF85
MALLLPGYQPHGIVAITKNLDTTAYVGDTETMVYQLPFIAAPKRIYRVHLQVYAIDTDGTGDNTNANIRYAKNSMIIKCRWASGSTVTTSGSTTGEHRVTVYDDDSTTASGADVAFYLCNPPAGQLTAGISIATARASATYGQVRILPGSYSYFAVEDVGPFSE